MPRCKTPTTNQPCCTPFLLSCSFLTNSTIPPLPCTFPTLYPLTMFSHYPSLFYYVPSIVSRSSPCTFTIPLYLTMFSHYSSLFYHVPSIASPPLPCTFPTLLYHTRLFSLHFSVLPCTLHSFPSLTMYLPYTPLPPYHVLCSLTTLLCFTMYPQ